MKILMTADPIGGVWAYALELCRSLARTGDVVILATMGGRLRAEQRAAVAACRNVALHESRYRLEWMEEPWRDVEAAGEWLLELERRFRPDVVHLNGYAHGTLPWSAPVLLVGHSCVLSWWQAVHDRAAPAAWDSYRTAVTAGIRAADEVVAPTRAMLDALITHYGEPRSHRVIPNGVDAEYLPLGIRDAFGRYRRHAAYQRRAAYRRDAARPQPIVLAVGRVWDEAKNLMTLAAAAPRIRWPVHVAGADRHPAGGRRRLPGVRQHGPLSPGAVRQWYRRAAILVQPSLYEPFGLVPLEAALADCALVLGDIPSLREVWGDAAVYVPPRDPSALAAAVNALADRPLTLMQQARAARMRATALTARRMTRAYRSAYLDLLQRPAARTEVIACAS